MKSLSLLHKNSRHNSLLKSLYQFRSLMSAPHHDEIDPALSSIHSISSDPLFWLLHCCKTLSSLRKFHSFLIVNGQNDYPLLKTRLISKYGLFGHFQNARLLFDEIPNPDFSTCKVMIRWYFLYNLYREVIGFYGLMRQIFVSLDNIVFSIVLKACTELCVYSEGNKLHGHIVKVGQPDSFVLTGLVDMYAKCGEIEAAREIFDEIQDRNVICWTSMIVGCVQNDYAKDALLLFNRMRGCLVEGNEYTFGSLVAACTKLGALHQGKWLHGYAIKNGFGVNSHLATALVDMYAKCGFIEDARSVFDESLDIDTVSWTAMVVGYSQSGYAELALSLFMDKKWEGVLPNSTTVASVLSACGQIGNLMMGTSIHSLGIKLGLDDTNVKNALIDMYAKCHRIGDAYYLFEMLSETDVVSWNSIICGFSRNGLAHDAFRLFYEMRLCGLQPDSVTVLAMLSACASLCAIRFGSSLHAFSVKEGLLSCNVHVGTALLNLYAKCGDAKSARSVFDGMIEKNRVTWSAMIAGYGTQGDSSNCLALFDDMVKEAVEPSDIIFTTILSACSHAGMITEGWRYFDMMCQDYDYVPLPRHYACMVDLLARFGRLEEALEFIENMPIQLDIAVFGAFLNGCNIHSRFDLGQIAVNKMLELYPPHACHYVLASNLYASNGRWGKVSEIRDYMTTRGLRKSPSSSLVNVDFDNEFYSTRVASVC